MAQTPSWSLIRPMTACKHFNLQDNITRSDRIPTIIIFYFRLRLRTQIKTITIGPSRSGHPKLHAWLIERCFLIGLLLALEIAAISQRNNWSPVVANRQLVSETKTTEEMKRVQPGNRRTFCRVSRQLYTRNSVAASSYVHNSSN